MATGGRSMVAQYTTYSVTRYAKTAHPEGGRRATRNPELLNLEPSYLYLTLPEYILLFFNIRQHGFNLAVFAGLGYPCSHRKTQSFAVL